MGEARFVRLRVDAKTKQHSVKFEREFFKFNEPGIWKKVPLELAEILAAERQVVTQKSSPPLFDVCTEDEAKGIDAEAKAKREALKAKTEPTVETAEMVGFEEEKAEEGRGDMKLDDVAASRAAALKEAASKPSSERLISPMPVKSKGRKKGRR